MKTKHTPGPWSVNHTGKHPEYDFVYSANNDTVCQLFNVNEEDFKNRKANAILIAAAPELLDALVFVLDSYERYCPERYYSDVNVMIADDVIKKATE